MFAKLTNQGSGSVSGHLAQDVVRLGNTAVKSQYFGAVNEESEDFTDSPHSGVMGELDSSSIRFSTLTSRDGLLQHSLFWPEDLL